MDSLGRSFDSASNQNLAVDSADIVDSNSPARNSSNGTKSFLATLFERMNPAQCIAPQVVPSCVPTLFDEDSIDLDTMVPKLAKDIRGGGKARSAALLQLYRLTDRDRKFNRIPIVCTTKFNIFESIAPSLAPEASSIDRRQALLLVNNLCVPKENKAKILLGQTIESILPPLLRVIRERLPECYLATVCLFNLSFLDDAKSLMITYVPSTFHKVRTEYHFKPPSDDPEALIRVIESLMEDYSPFLGSKNVHSVQAEAFRWCMGIARNLSTLFDNAVLIAKKTIIPRLAVKGLASADENLALWTRDSLPDACLVLMVHLVQFDDCVSSMNSRDAKDVLTKLMGKGGIHETRAKAILFRLDGREPPVNISRLEEKKE